MSREKGFIYALEAVATLVAEGATYIRYGLVGGGPEKAAIESFIAAHGLEPYVTAARRWKVLGRGNDDAGRET